MTNCGKSNPFSTVDQHNLPWITGIYHVWITVIYCIRTTPIRNCENQKKIAETITKTKESKNDGIKWWDQNEIKMRSKWEQPLKRKETIEKSAVTHDYVIYYYVMGSVEHLNTHYKYPLYQSTARSAAAIPEEQPDSVSSVVKWSTVAASLGSLTATQGSPTCTHRNIINHRDRREVALLAVGTLFSHRPDFAPAHEWFLDCPQCGCNTASTVE